MKFDFKTLLKNANIDRSSLTEDENYWLDEFIKSQDGKFSVENFLNKADSRMSGNDIQVADTIMRKAGIADMLASEAPELGVYGEGQLGMFQHLDRIKRRDINWVGKRNIQFEKFRDKMGTAYEKITSDAGRENRLSDVTDIPSAMQAITRELGAAQILKMGAKPSVRENVAQRFNLPQSRPPDVSQAVAADSKFSSPSPDVPKDLFVPNPPLATGVIRPWDTGPNKRMGFMDATSEVSGRITQGAKDIYSYMTSKGTSPEIRAQSLEKAQGEGIVPTPEPSTSKFNIDDTIPHYEDASPSAPKTDVSTTDALQQARSANIVPTPEVPSQSAPPPQADPSQTQQFEILPQLFNFFGF